MRVRRLHDVRYPWRNSRFVAFSKGKERKGERKGRQGWYNRLDHLSSLWHLPRFPWVVTVTKWRPWQGLNWLEVAEFVDCFFQCLCTLNDGHVEETCKHRMYSCFYHQPEQHRSIRPFWSNLFALKWKYSVFWRNTGLLAGNINVHCVSIQI